MSQSAAKLATNQASRPPFGLTADAFGDQFASSFRLFWVVAAGIVKDPGLAEDVVQEAGLIGLSKLDQYRKGTNFKAWMCQIVRYVAINQSRKQVRRCTTTQDPGVLDRGTVSSRNDPSLDLRLTEEGQLPPEQSHFDDALMEALSSVSPVARACLLLRTIEEMDYARIAELLDIPKGTAMSHVHRARQLLRSQLTDSRGPAPRPGTRP